MSNISESLSKLHQRIIVIQELIRRCRMRRRIGIISGCAGVALAALAVVMWLLILPVGQRFIPSFLVGIIGATSIAYGFYTRFQPSVLLNRSEKLAIGATFESRATLPELELEFSLARESRRLLGTEERLDHPAIFKDDILFYIDELRANSTRSRRVNHLMQVTTIVGSLGATGVSSLAYAFGGFKIVTIALTFIVGAASGIAAYFKFKDRSFYAQQTANAIEQEVVAYRLGIGRYKNLGGDDAEVEFLQEVHRLRVEQKNREQNLDEPVRKASEGE